MSINPVQPVKTYSPVKKAAKVATGVVLTAGITAAALAFGAKRGIFAQGSNKYINFAKKYMQTAGDFINTNLAKVSNKVKNFKINGRIVNSKAYKNVKSGFSSFGKKVHDFDLKNKVLNKINNARSFVESHLHPEKLN